MKQFCALPAALVLLAAWPLAAQEIVTAERYLERVSEVYAGFRDYEASIAIRSGQAEMYGMVSHLEPDFLRLDFSTPAEQVIVFNGGTLTVYLPEYRAILTQDVTGSGMRGASLATGTGLSLLRRNYGAAFITGPAPVPLDEGSREKVVMLRLTRRYGSEEFKEIILSVDPATLLIRRMEGTTAGGAAVRFDFSNVKTNQGMPEQRFLYDSPASANVYHNFLFRDAN